MGCIAGEPSVDYLSASGCQEPKSSRPPQMNPATAIRTPIQYSLYLILHHNQNNEHAVCVDGGIQDKGDGIRFCCRFFEMRCGMSAATWTSNPLPLQSYSYHPLVTNIICPLLYKPLGFFVSGDVHSVIPEANRPTFGGWPDVGL